MAPISKLYERAQQPSLLNKTSFCQNIFDNIHFASYINIILMKECKMLKVKISKTYHKAALLSAVLSIAGVMNAHASDAMFSADMNLLLKALNDKPKSSTVSTKEISNDTNRFLEDLDAKRHSQMVSEEKIQEMIKNNPMEGLRPQVQSPQISMEDMRQTLLNRPQIIEMHGKTWKFAPRYSTYYEKLIDLDPSKYTLQATSPSTVAMYDPDRTTLPIYCPYEITPRKNFSHVEAPAQSSEASELIVMQPTTEEPFDLKFVLEYEG